MSDEFTLRLFLVTIKAPKNPKHNPRAKQTGTCPVNGGMICTDRTGEHHTVLVRTGEPFERVEAWVRATFIHVTRIEEVGLIDFWFDDTDAPRFRRDGAPNVKE